MGKDILFGVCADIHHGTLGVDEQWRIERFVKEAEERKADFIIQLGDLSAFPQKAQEAVAIFNSFSGPSYHVLGNHETERSDKETIMEILGMRGKYYSFDVGDYHFVVLDTNYEKVGDAYTDFDRSFSDCYISASQLEWLKADIAATEKRCFLFMHATCEVGDWRIQNLHQFREVLWRANEKAGYNKVTMVLSGHDHSDAYRFKGGIHYYVVNSMSHKFIGSMYTDHSSHADAVEADYGKNKWLIPYKEPLYAFVRLKANGLIQIIGKQSEYDGNSPVELHWEHYASPEISYREVWMNGIGEL